ncbi:unnamed protein product [Arctia plantaginis]|uniref:Uncharacterized protein n=1 Tax=Arctia plantaginis TaxID=874455 RepID=A0A8S0YZK3_ARCPL|nr:unnamed protein product [Arctia plantaginis]
MRHKDRLHLRARNKPSDPLAQLIYTRYRNCFAELIRKVKYDYDNKTLTLNKGQPKKLWETIKEICHISTKNSEPNKLLSPFGTNHWKQSLNLCNDHFGHSRTKTSQNNIIAKLQNLLAVCNILHTVLVYSHQYSHDTTTIDTKPKYFFLEPTDTTEVEAIIVNLDHNKALGIDNLSNSLVKIIRNSTIEPLTTIFNMSIT